MGVLLSDRSTYKVIVKDPCISLRCKMNAKLLELKKRCFVNYRLQQHQCLQPYGFVRISTDFLLLIRMYGSHTSPYGNSALSELTYATHRVVCTYVRTIVFNRPHHHSSPSCHSNEGIRSMAECTPCPSLGNEVGQQCTTYRRRLTFGIRHC